MSALPQPAEPPARPVAVLALRPGVNGHQVTAQQLARLRGCCEVPDPEPLSSFVEPRASGLLARAEVLLTGWGCPPVDTAVLDRAPRLRAIVHAAGSVKGHVTPACWERGVAVSSAASANAVPVAEYTLAAILFANKGVFQLQQRYRQARAKLAWAEELPRLGNYRKVVGVVGASRVGRRVLELLRPFDLSVQVYDPLLGEAEARSLGAALVDLDDLLRACDLVSLHAPALPSTRHLLDRRRLALLRDGATLVNTARGAIVDGRALEDELVSGRIAAVIDTTDPDVLPADSPLYDLPNVFLTPHVAGALGTETQRLTDLALDEIQRFTRGEALLHGVARADLEHLA